MSAVDGAGVGGDAREPDRRRPTDLAEPIDADLRRRVATDLDTTFLVEAGAGTGKTQVLVDRYLACLSADEAPPIAAVVAITFTEKAAGELRQRIRGELERLVAGDGPSARLRERLSLALAGLDDAPISTIHAFAARLLRERPVEARVDPAFEQLDQVGSELLGERLWRDWLSGLLDADRAYADQPSADRPDGAGPASQLAEILRAGVPIEQIAQLARARFAERFAIADCDPPAPPELTALIAAAKADAVSLAAAARDCADDADRLKCGSLDLAAEAAALPDSGDLHELGRALTIAAGRTGPFTRKNAGKAVNWPGGKERMLADRDALRDRISEAAGVYGAYVAGLALAVAADFARTAAAAQTEAGVLDFDDLLGRARDLLAGAPGADPAEVARVRGSFQRRYRYLLVDEFQDTDPLQAEIAFLLAEREPTARSWRDVELRPGKLFLVGDPKQSIYRFRRADIAMYHEVAGLVRGQGGEVVTLRQNFRTVASIVSWVNGVFEELMPAPGVEGLQPAYAALAPYRPDGEPGRNVVVVRAPAGARRKGAGRPPTPAELCRHEAGVVAGLLSDMERLGWMVRDGERAGGGWRRATPGDVALLLPTFTHVGYYEQALREAGLPYRVEGGRTFFGRREVLDTLAVLHALDAAADPVAVYAALHGQLFAFSDDDLYAFHAAGGAFDYLGAAPPQAFPEIAAALADLRGLHERRNLRPPAETLDDLVRRTGLLESLALWADDPEQAIGNIGELISLADEFADSAEATFHAFVAKSRRDVAAADTAESPVGEAGEFVRLLTVHKAKGLEFPIVVLAAGMLTPRAASRDPLVDRGARRLDCSLSGESPDPDGAGATVRFQSAAYETHFEHEKGALEAERSRLLYVALTRAADLLVLPVVASEPRQGSLQALWQGAPGGGRPRGVRQRAATWRPKSPLPAGPATLLRDAFMRIENGRRPRRPRSRRRLRSLPPTRWPGAKRGAGSAPRFSRAPRARRRSSRRAPWNASNPPTGSIARSPPPGRRRPRPHPTGRQ